MASPYRTGFVRQWVFVLVGSVAMARAQPASVQESEAGSLRDPIAVQQVLRGERATANAAWWGFDPVDSTHAIQSAIRSGAKTVVVPFVGADWVVGPITLRSNLELVLEPGVVLAAKPRAFQGMFDALLMGTEVENVLIRGYGATLRMRKEEYLSSDYVRSEFRHTLALYGCGGIKVLGLTLENSGGDGIYLGPVDDERRVGCRDVLIRDCVCRNNYRQGLSMLSGRRVRIENCQFRNTRGTAPQAGLDLEPGGHRDVLSEVEILNCRSEDNEGSAFVVNIMRLTADSEPVSIRFWNCLGRSTKHPGLRLLVDPKKAPRGTIEYVSCTVENTEYAGLYSEWNPSNNLAVRFTDCKWSTVARKRTEVPIQIKLVGGDKAGGTGNIEFIDSIVFDDRERVALQFSGLLDTVARYGVSGELRVVNRHTAPLPPQDQLRKTGLRIRTDHE